MKTIRSFLFHTQVNTKQISKYWSSQHFVHIFLFFETYKVHDQTHLEIPPGSFMQCSELWATIPRHFQNLKNSKISSKYFQNYYYSFFSKNCYLALHLVSPLSIESIMESIRSSFISKGSSPISFSLLFSSTPDLLDLLPLGSIGTSRKNKG